MTARFTVLEIWDMDIEKLLSVLSILASIAETRRKDICTICTHTHTHVRFDSNTGCHNTMY